MMVEGSPGLFWARVLLRFLQFALSLVALITLSAAFVSTSYFGYGSMLGSSATTYATIVTYTGMILGLWFLLFIHLMRMCGRPLLRYEQALDFLMAVLLLVAAIVLLVSDYVQHCSRYDGQLRCRSLRTSVVFMFLAMAAYLLTLLLSFFEKTDKRDYRETEATHRTVDLEHGSDGPMPAPYHAGVTPTARGPGPNHTTRV